MKIVELTNSIKLPVSNEEYSLLRSIGSGTKLKSELNQREQHLAGLLVNKDVLKKTVENGIVTYSRKK